MEHIAVRSSNIASVGYDESTETLEVAFIKGGIYQYQGIPKHLFEQLLSAPSVGQFFSYNIKNLFLGTRVG